MKFGGICIETDNAPRLAEFYKIVLQEEPFVEGNHYGFGNIAVYDPGRVTVAKDKNIWLQCFTADLDAEYGRLLQEIPGIEIISPLKEGRGGRIRFGSLILTVTRSPLRKRGEIKMNNTIDPKALEIMVERLVCNDSA